MEGGRDVSQAATSGVADEEIGATAPAGYGERCTEGKDALEIRRVLMLYHYDI